MLDELQNYPAKRGSGRIVKRLLPSLLAVGMPESVTCQNVPPNEYLNGHA